MTEGIGGYFELELRRGGHYHTGALRLNTARNCLEYVLRTRRYTRVHVPYYTCGAVLEPLRRLDVTYEFYAIDGRLEPKDTVGLKEGEAFLYTNYFGLKQECVERLAGIYGGRLIVDDAQAFYAPRVEGVDTFYSPRKFFGVSDGGYLYTDGRLEEALSRDVSWERMGHLLRRVDEGAEAGYALFRENEDALDDNPIRLMSRLTERMLEGVDYERAGRQRRENFLYLHKRLKGRNWLDMKLQDEDVPMVYPFWTDGGKDLRKELIRNKIYVATYWPNVLEWTEEGTLEYDLTKNVVALPVDQRYTKKELEHIVNLLL